MSKTPKGTNRRIPSRIRRTSDALEIIEARFLAKDPGLRRLVDQATENARIAQLIYTSRTEAGLSQAQLAQLVGTTQSVISRLEDSDYRGHSLMLLRRIAKALGKRLELRLVPEREAG
jgi:ribosome-binding protein aMBF1 (putative translation factor)